MTSCIVCGGLDAGKLYDGLLQCKECAYVYADLEMTGEDFHKLYGEDYFHGEEYSSYLADKKVLQKNFRLRLKILERFLGPDHRRLLEIGSAYGFFLELIKDRFETVQGIDVTEEGTRYAREQLGVPAAHGDLRDYDFGAREFDVVCMWDTIEHLERPDLCLQKISQYTSRGALLAITTGDIESLNARFKKRNWRLIHPPTHVHYFSRNTIAKFLNNYGFDVVYSKYCGFYRSIDNIAYNILVLRKKMPRLYRFLVKSRLTRLDLYLNLYDIMYVIAKKR